jgi:hypothetical protein
VPDYADEPHCLFILTELFSYQLHPFSDNGSPTWEAAVVTGMMPRTEARLPANREVHSIRAQIEIIANPRGLLAPGSQSGRDLLDWTQLIAAPPPQPEDAETKTLLQSVLLLQVIDAALRTLEILPVEIANSRTSNGRFTLQVAPRPDSVRDIAALELGERSTADVLDRLFDKDDLGIDVEWRLSSSGGLGSRAVTDTPVRFLTVARAETGQSVYEFAASDVPQNSFLFLRKKGDHGTESLIRRRLQTSQVLADQRDLVAMFADPRRRLRASGENLERDSHFDWLDDPKQQALEAHDGRICGTVDSAQGSEEIW